MCALDLAIQHGWRPMGTTAPDAELEAAASRQMRWAPETYFLPRGQTITARDARELGHYLEVALALVSDREIPLHDGAFGELNTLHAIQLAIAGDHHLPREWSATAKELLSGSPKADAYALAEFLRFGAVRVLPYWYEEPPRSSSSPSRH